MTTAEDIEKAVEQLAPRELARFRAWFEAFDAQQFDAAIERDARAGKLGAHADEALAAPGARAITLRGSQKRLRAEYDPIASGLPRITVHGRLFLSEHTDDNRFRHYKGGFAQRNPPPKAHAALADSPAACVLTRRIAIFHW